MGAQGTGTIDFGALPGKCEASVDVVAAGVVVTSLVEAWICPVATADHSVDEHVFEQLRITGAYLSDGNIRIRAFYLGRVLVPATSTIINHPTAGESMFTDPNPNEPNPYGLFTVAWVWN